MIGLSRRRLCRSLIAGPALALAAPHLAKAADFQFRYCNNLPSAHPLNLRAQEFARAIAEKSNGQVTVSIFPDNQLGGYMAALLVGLIDVACVPWISTGFLK